MSASIVLCSGKGLPCAVIPYKQGITRSRYTARLCPPLGLAAMSGGISIQRVKREFREIISSEEVQELVSRSRETTVLVLGGQVCHQDRAS